MLATFTLSTALFWACLHALAHLLDLRRNSSTLLLPLASSPRAGIGWSNRPRTNDRRTQITLRYARLTFSTSRLNDAHNSLASCLKHDPVRTTVKAFYNLGAIVGVVVTVISPLALALTIVWMAKPLFYGNVEPSIDGSSHMKRSNAERTEPLTPSYTQLRLLVSGSNTQYGHKTKRQ